MVLVLLDLDGDLKQGATVTLEIRTEAGDRAMTQTRTRGKLPPQPELLELYQQWRSLYYNLGFLSRLEDRSFAITHHSSEDAIAQEFLKSFLAAFSGGNSLYLSVREAREKLQSLEDRYPCATWLPILCQNPTETPVTWKELINRKTDSKAQLETQRLGKNSSSLGREKIQNPKCPYRGLSAFTREDAPFFFGRERFAEKLLETVNQQPFVAPIGPSGSGKSSVVFAGLIPRLTNWIVVIFRPGNNPFFELAKQLIPELEPNLSETDRSIEINKLTLALQSGDLTLVNISERILQKHPQYQRFLLVADQFEELYTLSEIAPESPRPSSGANFKEDGIPFLDLLLAAVRKTQNFTLVLTLRADFCDRALSYGPFAEILYQYHPVLIGPMNRQELRDAIVQPAAKVGASIAEGLTERILDAVEREPGHLPLLEFALTLLWERQENGELTHKAYDAIGGVERALADYAEQIYNQLSPAEQQQVRLIFTQLVRPGEGTADTRRVAARDEFGQGCDEILQRLADARLIVLGERSDRSSFSSNKRGEQSVELVHEALIQAWQRLRQWIDNDRAFRTWQERSRGVLRQWETNSEDQGLLLRGTPLLEAQRWLQDRPQEIGDREKTYIEASLTRDRRERQAQTNLQRKAAIALSAALCGSLSLAGIATWQWQRAQLSDLRSRLSSLVVTSEEFSNSSKEIDALVERIRAAQQLQSSRETNPEIRMRVIAALRQTVYSIREFNSLEGHESTVSALAWSPNNKFLLSGSHDNTVKLWRKDGQLLNALTGHRDRIQSVAWNPDGTIFASASDDKTIKLWKLEATSQEVALLQTLELETQVDRIEFSPDGQRLAAAGRNGTVKLWQLNSRLDPEWEFLDEWKAHRSWVTALSFSPDGETLATGSSDKTIKIWNRDGDLIRTLIGHQGTVNSVAFSPDGMLLSASKDQTAKLWNLDDESSITLTGHSDRVWDATWSADGQLIATASRDGTIKLWQRNGSLKATLEGHNSAIHSVRFSPDGKTLASASADTTIKFWHPDPKPPIVLKHDVPVRDLAFSPTPLNLALLAATEENPAMQWLSLPEGEARDSRRSGAKTKEYGGTDAGYTLAVASADGRVRLWNPFDFKTVNILAAVGNLKKLDWSPDGQFLFAVSTDGFVKQLPVNTVFSFKKGSNPIKREEELQFPPQSDAERLEEEGAIAAKAVSFSADGRTVALLKPDGAIEIGQKGGKKLQILQEPNFKAIGLQLSDDGQQLAAIGDDETVKIWQRNYQGQFEFTATLRGHTSDISDVAWSPDSKILASASIDGTIELWQRQSQFQRLHTLKGHLNPVNSISFSPDGQVLASGSNDKTVKLWSLNGNLLKTLKEHQSRVSAVAWSSDGRYLASASDDQTTLIWDFDLDRLLVQGCMEIQDYLKTNPNLTESDRRLCDRI